MQILQILQIVVTIAIVYVFGKYFLLENIGFQQPKFGTWQSLYGIPAMIAGFLCMFFNGLLAVIIIAFGWFFAEGIFSGLTGFEYPKEILTRKCLYILPPLLIGLLLGRLLLILLASFS
ncbi:MAG: hypothetical protein WC473_02695 [Patescibacteria group bacterium]